MNKKGFTLVEMIIVITIIVSVTVGSIVGYSKIKSEAYKTECEEVKNALINATDIYVYTTYDNGSLIASDILTNDTTKCITLDTLKNAGLIKAGIKNPETNATLDYTTCVTATNNVVIKYTYNSFSCE